MSSPVVSLSSARSRRLRQALDHLRTEADLRHVSLIHDSGMVLCESGDGSCKDQGELGALATGAFFAARELARRVGDSDFSGLHYDGRNRHFFVASLSGDAFLFCVFANETKIAIVRACVARAANALAIDLVTPDTSPILPGDFAIDDRPPAVAHGAGPLPVDWGSRFSTDAFR